MNTKTLPAWAEAAAVVLEACLSEMAAALLLQEVEQKRLLLQKQGWEVQITGRKL
ncbi:hypothetical protein [Trichocoleus sp. FACHB-591]|uniref:hypothetical protein n=1 Tax=Trichocoleus sp. FACHB-591 TaxID=2692872 RepID=UPI001F556775|nr:hypothetical protein [Trichocoleus sp. FACHB-591]